MPEIDGGSCRAPCRRHRRAHHPGPARAGLDFERKRGHSRIRRARKALILRRPRFPPGFCVFGPRRAMWSWGALLCSGCIDRLVNAERTRTTSVRLGFVFFVWVAAHAWRVRSKPISGSLHPERHGNPVSSPARASRLSGQHRINGLPGESAFARPIRHRGALKVKPIPCLLSGK